MLRQISHEADPITSHRLGARTLRADRRRQVLDYVRMHSDLCGAPPTIAEIGEALDIPVTGSVRHYLRVLVREGLLLPAEGTARGYRLPIVAKVVE